MEEFALDAVRTHSLKVTIISDSPSTSKKGPQKNSWALLQSLPESFLTGCGQLCSDMAFDLESNSRGGGPRRAIISARCSPASYCPFASCTCWNNSLLPTIFHNLPNTVISIKFKPAIETKGKWDKLSVSMYIHHQKTFTGVLRAHQSSKYQS